MSFTKLMKSVQNKTDAVNLAGGKAYGLTDPQALARVACTGCLGATYYASAEDQLDTVLALANSPSVTPEFLAKTAVYAAREGLMRDVPAVLLAVLRKRDATLFRRAFPKVAASGKMVRKFCDAARSGVAGSRSLGYAGKQAVRGWFAARGDDAVFRNSSGQGFSLLDAMALARVKPGTPERQNLYLYLSGSKEYDRSKLPESARKYLDFLDAPETAEVPDLGYDFFSGVAMSPAALGRYARVASYPTLLYNLADFSRKGVFDDPAVAQAVADRLGDPLEVGRARVFPYAIMRAYVAAEAGIPAVIREALHDAMEVSCSSVPGFGTSVAVAVDVSGSMQSPVSGYRGPATSKVRCVDVASLFGVSILRVNRDAVLIPFDERVHDAREIRARDSVVTNAQKLARYGGGGTDCGAALAFLNRSNATPGVVVMISDSESWFDPRGGPEYRWGQVPNATTMQAEWRALKARCPQAKLVCVDLTPNTTSQVKDADDVLFVGGFSDAVFDVVARFCAGGTKDHWVGTIEATEL